MVLGYQGNYSAAKVYKSPISCLVVLGYQGDYSVAKMSDFIRMDRVLKILFMPTMHIRTVSLYVKYCTIGIFEFFR